MAHLFASPYFAIDVSSFPMRIATTKNKQTKVVNHVESSQVIFFIDKSFAELIFHFNQTEASRQSESFSHTLRSFMSEMFERKNNFFVARAFCLLI